ncbi:MAG: radical SAM protein [Planctomycetes bacterium]|nr:radical SAM protein [Planctomycetota bacterium]
MKAAAVPESALFPGRSAHPACQPWDLCSTMVYGPVRTRRLGRSLGINLLPSSDKWCTLNCVYCQLGWSRHDRADLDRGGVRFPPIDDLRTELAARLRGLTGKDALPESITFSGNGEPTLHPEFPRAVEVVRMLRDAYAPKASIGILTNGTTLLSPETRAACDRCDERYVKCDAGEPRKMKAVNLPLVPFTIAHLIEGSRLLRDHVVQAMFVSGRPGNADPSSVAAWIRVVERMGPKRVQIYTLARVPAARTLEAVPADRLHEIARRCEEATGLPTEVYDTLPAAVRQ